jgi:DNA gyrase inhibitor GyrI
MSHNLYFQPTLTFTNDEYVKYTYLRLTHWPTAEITQQVLRFIKFTTANTLLYDEVFYQTINISATNPYDTQMDHCRHTKTCWRSNRKHIYAYHFLVHEF